MLQNGPWDEVVGGAGICCWPVVELVANPMAAAVASQESKLDTNDVPLAINGDVTPMLGIMKFELNAWDLIGLTTDEFIAVEQAKVIGRPDDDDDEDRAGGNGDDGGDDDNCIAVALVGLGS